MNIVFWALMVLMLLLAIAMLVYPLIRVRQDASAADDAVAYKDSNLQINAEKIRELDQDLAEGRIDQAFYQAAREELDRELLIDIPEVSQQTAAEHYTARVRRHPAMALMISVFVPMLAFLTYLQLGMHAASDDSFLAEQRAGSQNMTADKQQASIEEMTKTLQQRLENEGGTVEDWAMLGRAHKYLGELELSEKAFAVALEQDSDNAQLMLERAEVMALANERKFNDESYALVMRAYELQPENPNVLWFAGVARFQYGDNHQAIELLIRLIPMAGGEEEVLKSIVSIVSQARQKLVDAGEDMPPMEALLAPAIRQIEQRALAQAAEPQAEEQPATGQVATEAAPVSTGRRLQVAVSISDAARAKFDANDTVFVYARAKQGPRMPLAVQKLTLAELPATVVLDDSMAMIQGMNLSAFDDLEVLARVSKSGSAIAVSGDYIGQQDVSKDKPVDELAILIENTVP